MSRVLATLLACLAAALAHAADKPASQAVAVTLEPGKVHEECMKLDKGDKRRYHWKASAPVDFNIHYHRGPEVFYPVKRNAMRGDGGTFAAGSAEEYCWMWTARAPGTKVEAAIDAPR
ncbi:MAG TPA: hypothetical protein VEC19_14320 [Usitatibacter sp.]|nr:hypothetical protein [Usitatibacter sp.]